MVEVILRKESKDHIHGVYRYEHNGFVVGSLFPNEYLPFGAIAIAQRNSEISRATNLEYALSQWVQILYPPEFLKMAIEREDFKSLHDVIREFRGIYEPAILIAYLLNGRNTNEISVSAVTAPLHGLVHPSAYKGIFVNGRHLIGQVSKQTGKSEDMDHIIDGNLTEEFRASLKSKYKRPLTSIEIEIPVSGKIDASGKAITDVIKIKPAQGVEVLLT